MASAVTIVSDAYKLIREHPEFWDSIERQAATDYAAHRKMSINRYVNNSRSECMISTNSDGYGVPNHTAPVLSRILVSLHPEYRDSITIHPSKVDSVFHNEELIEFFTQKSFEIRANPNEIQTKFGAE